MEKVIFQQKWIENAVKRFLGKENEDICISDMKQIKYLRIGENFDNAFTIEMSKECPPNPFVAKDGGEEWEYACLKKKDISRFIQKEKEDFDHQLFLWRFEHEENTENVWSDNAQKNWDTFAQTIYKEEYYEEIEDEDQWEEWYEETKKNIYTDLGVFTEIQVLRIGGTHIPDFTVLQKLEQLHTLEVVGTYFEKNDGIEVLNNLEQLCCWLG